MSSWRSAGSSRTNVGSHATRTRAPAGNRPRRAGSYVTAWSDAPGTSTTYSTFSPRKVRLRTTPGTPVGATWVDQLSVASVTGLASGEARATTQTLGGRSTSLGSPTGAVAIAGGNDLDGLRVLSAEGGLLQQRGSAWQTQAGGISRLAVQN